MRLAAPDGEIMEVETIVARAETPGPFSDAAAHALDPVFTRPVAARDRTPRDRMIALTDAYLEAQQQFAARGVASPEFAAACAIVQNGEALAHGDDQTCGDLFANGAFAAIETVRDRHVIAVDEARGLVAVRAMVDRP